MEACYPGLRLQQEKLILGLPAAAWVVEEVVEAFYLKKPAAGMLTESVLMILHCVPLVALSGFCFFPSSLSLVCLYNPTTRQTTKLTSLAQNRLAQSLKWAGAKQCRL